MKAVFLCPVLRHRGSHLSAILLVYFAYCCADRRLVLLGADLAHVGRSCLLAPDSVRIISIHSGQKTLRIKAPWLSRASISMDVPVWLVTVVMLIWEVPIVRCISSPYDS